MSGNRELPLVNKLPRKFLHDVANKFNLSTTMYLSFSTEQLIRLWCQIAAYENEAANIISTKTVI